MNRTPWNPAWPLTLLTSGGVIAWLVGGPLIRSWSIAALYVLILGGLLWGALSRARREPMARPTWLALGAFGLLGTINALLLTHQLIRFGSAVPHPPPASLLLWAPALLCLLVALMTSPPRRPWDASRLLDGAVFSLAAYLGLWMWVVKPLMASHPSPLLITLGIHVVFLGACATLGVALHLWVERRDPPGSPLSFLALGLAWISLGLPWWAGVLLGGTFQHGHPVRLALAPGLFLLCLSTRAPWPQTQGRALQPLRFLLPYLPASVAFVGFLIHYLPEGADRDTPALALLGGLALCVLLRQALILRQLFLLNHTLEEKVEVRTRELARSQELLMETQQKNLVATLGAGITHDLNNLLGAAVGNLDLLRLKMGPDPDFKELEGLEHALERAGGLSKRIMALARDGVGPTRTFDLASHVDDLHPLLRAMVPRSIDLTWERGSTPIEIHANPGQLDQVLVNLVSNAKDATPSGGRICLRIRLEGLDAVIEVEDTGSGIPEGVMQRLFEPFMTTKPIGKGTGLGLSSVQAVVAHLGGRIEVHSVLQQGTTFTVRLPVAS